MASILENRICNHSRTTTRDYDPTPITKNLRITAVTIRIPASGIISGRSKDNLISPGSADRERALLLRDLRHHGRRAGARRRAGRGLAEDIDLQSQVLRRVHKVDGGFEQARKTILMLYEPFLAHLDPRHSGKDAKTALQEFLQGRRLALPQYQLRATHGEAHAQEFEVECLIPELGISTLGRGPSRRAAEQEAARRAFELTGAK